VSGTLQQRPAAADRPLQLAGLAQVLWDVRGAPGANVDQALDVLLPLLMHSAGDSAAVDP
jgi:hypothetical protein